MPGLRVANLVRDRKLLELAKAEATRIVEHRDRAHFRAQAGSGEPVVPQIVVAQQRFISLSSGVVPVLNQYVPR